MTPNTITTFSCAWKSCARDDSPTRSSRAKEWKSFFRKRRSRSFSERTCRSRRIQFVGLIGTVKAGTDERLALRAEAQTQVPETRPAFPPRAQRNASHRCLVRGILLG